MGFFDDFTDSLGITQHGQNSAHKSQQSSLAALFAQLQGNQNALYGQAAHQQKKALGAIQTGFQGAIDNSSRIGASSKQGVLDREQQSMGSLSQSMTDRGLFNSTAYDNARRGISSDTNRSLSSIDAALAQLQGGLLAQKGQAEAGQYDWLARLLQGQAGANSQLGLAQGQMQFGAPYNSSELAPGGAGQLAQLAAFFL